MDYSTAPSFGPALFERPVKLARAHAISHTTNNQKMHKNTQPNIVGAHHPQPHAPLF